MIQITSRSALGLALACGLSLAGCGGGSDDLPRQALWGKITLDGTPLKSGMITFDPLNVPTNPVSVGAPIDGGAYSIGKGDGATPGTYRVSIRSGATGGAAAANDAPGATPKARPKEPIPAKYNEKTELKAEVKAEGPNEFNFDLLSK